MRRGTESGNQIQHMGVKNVLHIAQFLALCIYGQSRVEIANAYAVLSLDRYLLDRESQVLRRGELKVTCREINSVGI